MIFFRSLEIVFAYGTESIIHYALPMLTSIFGAVLVIIGKFRFYYLYFRFKICFCLRFLNLLLEMRCYSIFVNDHLSIFMICRVAIMDVVILIYNKIFVV